MRECECYRPAPDHGHRLPDDCDSAQDTGPLDDDRLAGGGRGAAVAFAPREFDAPAGLWAYLLSPWIGRVAYRESAGRNPAHFQRAVWNLLRGDCSMRLYRWLARITNDEQEPLQ